MDNAGTTQAGLRRIGRCGLSAQPACSAVSWMPWACFVLEVLVVLVLDEYFFLFVDENLDQASAIAMLEFPLYFWFDFDDFRHECASVNLCLRQNSSRQVAQRYLFEGPSISLHEE